MHHQKLICYQKLLGIAQRVPAVLADLPRGESYLVDQLKRALASSILNLAEGNGRQSSRERRRFFDIALASIAEVAAVMDIIRAYQYISEKRTNEIKEELRISYAMLMKLKQSAL